MPVFSSDGVDIAYLDEGDGPAVLLIHGFASNLQVNWVDTGWVKTLVNAGRRVVAFDNRGHGQSQKLYDEALYGAPLLAEDARRLLDHLEIARADVLGYSMGARIGAFLALNHPARVRRVVFGGLGINMIKGMPGARPIALALRAPSIDAITNETVRTFRLFAEQTGSDREALAACILSSRTKISAEDIGRITAPVLIAVGSNDVIGGSAAELQALIPGARTFEIVGRDHMKAVGDRGFKEAVLSFLGESVGVDQQP